MIKHTIEPIFDENSKILILGTMPSPKSREAGFYYAHPQNRFWAVMSEIFGLDIPADNQGKKAFLLNSRIAMWDVLRKCDIKGANDGSIKNPVANDLSRILSVADIKKIYTTGTKAAELYKKLCYPKTGIESVCLPSTSSANRKHYSLEDLVELYGKAIKEGLKQ